MDITYLGHSSFKIKGKSAVIVTDPFDPGLVGFKYPAIEADIVTISHDHKDHNRADLVKNIKKIINGPGEYEVGGVSVLGFPSFHDDKKGAERGKNTLYVFEIDELRIAHLGDLGHLLSDEAVENLGNIDILMIPVGGFFTVNADQAVEISRKIDPLIILPMHYKSQGLNPETFAKIASLDDFLKNISATVVNLPKLTVNKEELGEDTKVVVLERK